MTTAKKEHGKYQHDGGPGGEVPPERIMPVAEDVGKKPLSDFDQRHYDLMVQTVKIKNDRIRSLEGRIDALHEEMIYWQRRPMRHLLARAFPRLLGWLWQPYKEPEA